LSGIIYEELRTIHEITRNAHVEIDWSVTLPVAENASGDACAPFDIRVC